MNNPVAKRIISAFIALLLLFYIGYQIYSANYIQVRTETAAFASVSDTTDANAVLIKKEKLMEQTVQGIVTYTVKNGGKVANGGTVAEVYNNLKDASVQQEINSLNQAINELTKLNNPGDTYAAEPNLLDKQINQKLISLLSFSNQQKYNEINETRNDLVYLLNERQIVTGKTKNFDEQIRSLKKERDELTAQNGKKTGVLVSPTSGYFISHPDGYELVYNYDKALSLTAEELTQKISQKPQETNAVGKICESFDWYLACVLPSEMALKIKVGSSVEVSMPFASNQSIPAVVAAVNQKNKDSSAAVVLKSNYMNDAIALARNEPVQIKIKKYSGIRVSQNSINFEKVTRKIKDKNGKIVTETKEVKGVYVLHGSEIEFVQIFPLFETNNYVICDEDSPKELLMTKNPLKLYDEVVTEGTDLHDGKIVK